MKHLVTKKTASKKLKMGRMTIDKLIDQGLEVYSVPKRKTPLVCVQDIVDFNKGTLKYVLENLEEVGLKF